MKITIYLSLTLVLSSLLMIVCSCKPKVSESYESKIESLAMEVNQVESMNIITQYNIVDDLIGEIKIEQKGFSFSVDTLLISTPFSGNRLIGECNQIFFSKEVEDSRWSKEPNVFYNKKLNIDILNKNNVYTIDILRICKLNNEILSIDVRFDHIPDSSPHYQYTYDQLNQKVIKKEFEGVIIN